MPVFTTACPRNCYSTCSLRVTVEEGRIRALEAHPGNPTTLEGPCLKGLAYPERVHGPARLLRPLRRRGDGFEPIAWEAALDLMAERFGRIRDRYGPQAVLYCTGSGTKGLLNGCGLAFWRAFGGCTATYGDLCWPAGLEATRLTLGDNVQSAPWDLARARLILLWGKNAAETNLHQVRYVDEALAAGARVVVIDPRRTPTAERAHLLIQPRPGTDGALALALARVLISRDLVDHAFVAQHVLGYEAFARRAEAWSLDRASEVTGVPPELIQALGEDLGRIRPASICAGFGMQRYTNAGQTMRALIALAALTGNIGIPGGGWVYANLATQIFGPLKDPLDFYPPEASADPVRVSVSIARLGRDMAAQKDPPLAAAWVERGNPLSQAPETPAVQQAFRALDFRVVVDDRLTDTAREADLVLPAKSLFEQSDVIGAYWHAFLQLRQKVLEPPGEVRPETDIYRALGQRLGLDDALLDSFLPAPGDAGVEAFLEARLAPHGLSLDALRQGPVLAPGAPEVAFADHRFPTPSGRIELESKEAAHRWGVDSLPDFREPLESERDGGPYPLRLLTPNTKDAIHSQFHALQAIRQLGARHVLFLNPVDAQARGLREGARVRVFNARGELRLPLHLDFSLRPGVAVAFNGFGEEDGGSVNRLSEGRETDLGHGAAFHDTLVDVARET